jgi:hypothetical protein
MTCFSFAEWPVKFNPYNTIFRPILLCTCLVVLPALTGCGSIIATVHINHAERALESARLDRAEELATYEFILAEAYLEKANEEWAHSDFQHANSYAKRSIISAEAAYQRAIIHPSRNQPSSVPTIVPLDE